MKKEKLSLKSIKNVLSRAEMKTIMAGSGPGGGGGCVIADCSPLGSNGVCCPGETCNGFGGDTWLCG